MEHIFCDVVKTDVSFIKIFQDLIFIGNGYYLHVYNKKDNSFKKRIYIFDQHIFGISIDANKNKLLIYGGKYLKVYSVNFLLLHFKEIKFHVHNDWILVAKFINNCDYIASISLHNVATLWNTSLEVIENKECMERCISYCAHLVNENWNDLIVLSGTVFSQILLWWPTKSSDRLSPVISRLIGHKGVIFSIDYNPILNIICSTSDDRTAKIWPIKSESLAKELSQSSSVNIDVKYTLTSHTARVFKCKILADLIVTAGEDGLVIIWNTNGEIIRKIAVHQGGPVWSLDCCKETNEIVTGGGDNGVSLFKVLSTASKLQLPSYLYEKPKRIVTLSCNSLVYISEEGVLVHYNIKNNEFSNICIHDDLKSYSLLEKSPCGSNVALAGNSGNLHFYKHLPKGLKYMFSCQITTGERIFSLHWLSCSALLICGPNGVLTLWIVQKHSTFPFHFWQLPYSKERWSTAACLCGTKNVLVGDRRGALYLYSFESSLPVQTIKRAHNYLGISNLYFHNRRVISLGRNSTINEYEIDEKDSITQISSHKVPFTWLASLYTKQSDNTVLLLGFSGSNFIIYDNIARRTLFETDCGGGHRSWDFYIENDRLIFCYIKDKHINLIDCNLPDMLGINIIKGYHLNEINALKVIRISGRSSPECLFVSGGEDTVMRISFKDFKDTLSDFVSLNVLKSHLSSIRTIALIKTSENKYSIFSAGGRSQIILWEFSVDHMGSSTLTSCVEKINFYEKLSDKDELETRVMDMSTLVVENEVFLFAGYSDGNVKLFTIESDNCQQQNLLLIENLSLYKSRCILKISILSVKDVYILVTMATDGFIVLSNVTDTLSNQHLHNEQIKNNRVISSFKNHQSGVNSFSCHRFSETEFIFLTGGDDTAICLNKFDVNTDKMEISHRGHYFDESYHGAQVTGAYILEKFFLTASIDQRVLLFRWNFQDVFNIQCLQEYNSSICDIQGMECALVDNYIKVFVFGRGCEILTVKLLKS